MLQLFQSNRIEALVTLIASQIRNNPQPNPLTPEMVLVQSPGMSQWLKLQLAQQNSIAANIDFPLPSSFIWRLYQALLPDVPKQSPFNKDRLAWRIFECLDELTTDKCFVPLIDYVQAAETVSHENSRLSVLQLRRFKLAEKIADVFDNYLMYRPHWLQHWLSGHNDLPDEVLESPEQVEWQAKLWRQCHELTQQMVKSSDQQGLYSRAELHQLALSALKRIDEKELLKKLPKRLFIFGVTSINQQQLELFDALSKRIDVQMFRLNPCQEYWGDVLSEKAIARKTQSQNDPASGEETYYVTGNPLLASWGKVGKDNNDLINQIEPQTTDLFIPVQAEHTVLGMIQRDIFELSYRQQTLPLTPMELISDHGKRALPLDDRSLSFNCCHSVVRELEVLKDQLLNWFENDNLKPQDVLVMVPDINTYAPYIDTIFGTDDEGAGVMPYAVSDRSDLSQHPVLQAFLSLFLLPQSRFTATELIGLLEIPQLAHNFDVSAEDIVLIKQWMASSHIKWGINSRHKAGWSLPEFEINTWLAGLKSLFIGMSDVKIKVWQDTYANPAVEGLQSAVLGKLLDFISYMVALSESMAEDCELSVWQQRGLQLFGDLFDQFDQDPLQPYVSHKITNVLSQLADYQTAGDFTAATNNQIVHHLLRQLLSSSGVNQSFVAGKVNFCTLMPMRSVPFEAICVLGLNESDYPRQVDPISFDLVAKFSPRKGDRSRKLDDRYLFLEALCSARQYFYASYLAFSVKDNSAMMPSVLLSELIEYVDDSFLSQVAGETASSSIKRTHRLQPFDADYFCSENNKLISYNRKWFEVISGSFENIELQQKVATKPLEQFDLDLEQLVRFWSHPVKYYYQNLLETRLEDYSEQITDTEVFHHDGLQKYQQLDSLLRQKHTDQPLGQNRPEMVSGAYPYGQWGEDLYFQYQTVTSEVHSFLDTILGDSEQRVETQFNSFVKIAGVQLSGSVDLHQGIQVLLRAGKSRFVDKLSTWIRHLFVCCHRPCTSYVASLDAKWQRFEAVPAERAKQLLLSLVEPWLQLYEGNVLFWHPKMAPTIADFELNDNVSVLQGQLAKLLEPSSFGVTLYDDDYAKRHKDNMVHIDEALVVFTQNLVADMGQFLSEAPPIKLAEKSSEVTSV